jgi:carboxyl-terminal processing protease
MKNRTASQTLIILSVLVLGSMLFSLGFFAGRLTIPFSSSTLASETGVAKDAFEPYFEAWNILNRSYIDQPIDPDILIQGSIRGMLNELGDPYTSYIDPQTFAQQNASLDGEYTGIGAWVDTSGENLVIISPIPDSPAEEAGLLPGDVVVAINGESMEGVDPALVLEKILGPENTSFQMTIAREGSDELLEFELTRAMIPLPSIESTLIEDEIGYIQIFSFANNTYTDFIDEINTLLEQDMKYLIIDLRNNPGGLVDPAIDLTSVFLEDKVLLIEEWGDGTQTTYNTTKDAILKDLPVYILVNQGTASASEIMAGALQDYDRATLIGNQTFGKGLIQNWIPLDGDNGAVRVTIARWLTPDGRQIQGQGLAPDFPIDLTLEDFDAGLDPQLDKALALIKQD